MTMDPGEQEITTDEANQMMVEATLGQEKTSIPGEYAQRYYEAMKAQIRDMMAKGYTPLPTSD